jgi:hypothetical protein
MVISAFLCARIVNGCDVSSPRSASSSPLASWALIVYILLFSLAANTPAFEKTQTTLTMT